MQRAQVLSALAEGQGFEPWNGVTREVRTVEWGTMVQESGRSEQPENPARVDEGTEALYRVLVEYVSDLITVVDQQGRFIFVNCRAAQVFGHPPEDCIGRLATEFVHPDDVERTAAWLRGLVADRQPAGSIENRQLGSDGSICDVLWNVVLHDDFVGRPQVYAVGRDVTGVRRTQRELEDRVSQLEDAQSIARLGYYAYDVSSDAWESSRVLNQILGIDDSFIRNRRAWLSLVHPDDRAMVAGVIQRDLRGEDIPLENEYRMVRRSDGETRWIHSLGRRDLDANGTVVRIAGTIMDVTEKRLSEQMAESAKEELKKHFELLEDAQSIASLGYYDYDIVAGLWTSSALMDSIFGIDADYVRSLEGWLGIVHPKDRGMMAAYLGEMLADHGSFDKTYRIARISDGEMRWVHGLGRVTYDQSGAPLRMIGTISDITERKMLEDELERQRARVARLALDVLDRREHERRLLAAELHDGVAQILAAAKMLAGQLHQDCSGTPNEEVSQRLSSLLGVAIADARSLTAELSHPVLSEAGLGPALSWLADSHEERFGLQCILEVDPNCNAMSDRSAVLLYRAVRELLNNVHKHSGTDRAYVLVTCEGNEVTARVEDSGVGFDATLGVDESRQEGQRFGLRSVREELELAQGALSIESSPGHGTAVSVRLPASIATD